jgi:hypothetical protein
MEPLATEFDDRTYHYTQLERHGNLALYEQRHKELEAVRRYEVVRIRERPAHTWPNGTTSPAREAYPSTTAWGRDGWTCFSRMEAQALLARLLREEDL